VPQQYTKYRQGRLTVPEIVSRRHGVADP
jgi:hypothetical protein